MLRPLQHLADLARDYPGIWRLVDMFRGSRGESLPRWADWCFLPLAAAHAIVTQHSALRAPLDLLRDIPRIGALAAWRPTQGIYRVEETLLDALWSTPMDGELPVELLFRLPEWCVYFETPGRTFLETPLHGFYVHLEEDQNETGHYELRLLPDTDDPLGTMPIPIHLDYGSTIEAGLFKTMDEGRRNQARQGLEIDVPTYPVGFSAEIESLVSLVLYLCSEEPDIGSPGVRRMPARPTGKKTKSGWRLFPPDKPTVWSVGHTLGTALRRAYERERQDQGGTHASPRPHIRRAHWHSFWKGPKKQPLKRHLMVKWLPPIPVGLAEDEETGSR